jgi:hypothetical protein
VVRSRAGAYRVSQVSPDGCASIVVVVAHSKEYHLSL